MPDTITPNYSLIKPEVTGSTDTWGGKLNGNFDALDAALKPVSDKAGLSLKKSGVIGDRTTDDFIFLKTGLDPSLQSGDAVMNNSAVRALLNALCPIGTILMWGGTIATIPAGWALCDGRTVGSVTTPNLTNRFPIAASATAGLTPGSAGGTYTLSYSGNVGGHLLTVNEMPAHSHSVYDPSHVHGVSDPGHAHAYLSPLGGQAGAAVGGYAATVGQNNTTGAAGTGIGIAAAVTGIALYNNGGSQYHDHPISFAISWQNFFPAYYALVFMMRVQAF